MRPSVSLVIPMYNEELNIERAVAASREALERYAGAWEIIIVDRFLAAHRGASGRG